MIQSRNYLVFDIECAPAYSSYGALPDRERDVWDAHSARNYPEMDAEAAYTEKAALHPEFGRVVSVSAGYFTDNEDEFKIKNWCGDNEKGILEAVAKAFSVRKPLAGHYILEYDIPFLAKRMVKHQIAIPNNLFLVGVKPWEVHHLDTYNWWKMGSFKNSCSLDVLLMHLGIESSKTEMDGSMVGEKFWKGEYTEIARYNNADVIAVAKVLCFIEGRDWEKVNVVEA
jgi:predicted PolB exonuclease-like 3'-5' exonuclease